MGLGRDIYSDITFFAAAWTGGCIRENVEDCTGQMDIKIIHIDYEGNPLMLQLMVVYFGPYYLFGMRISTGYRMTAVLIGFCN